MNLEVNEREISPVNIWLNGISSTAVVLSLNGYSGYNFIDSPGQVHYNLKSYDVSTDTKTTVISGVCSLDWSTVASWGIDDQPIFDYVANELNITLEGV
jgi:hypothetical protein